MTAAAAGLVIAAVANSGAMYFVAAYADAAGHLPGLGYFLRWSGLAAEDLTQIDATSDHDGVRLHVSAASADENATVVILDYQGPAGAADIGGFESLTLHDQFAGNPSFSGAKDRVSGQLDYILTPGVYRLLLVTPDGTEFERSVTVP